MRPGTTGASLFSNPTTGGGGGNLFGQPGAGFGVGTTGATGGMGGTTGTANMFANPTTGTTPSLFSTPATTGTATNMFNPNPAPSGGNLFGQPSTATNPAASGSLFSAPTFNQPAGGNMFAPGVSNPQNPTQGYTKEQQMMQCAEFIAGNFVASQLTRRIRSRELSRPASWNFPMITSSGIRGCPGPNMRTSKRLLYML